MRFLNCDKALSSLAGTALQKLSGRIGHAQQSEFLFDLLAVLCADILLVQSDMLHLR